VPPPGDEIIVQVIKEGIGTKGPTLSSYLSVSGKMLVMMPGVSGRGVSRKIEDEDERRRLKQILTALARRTTAGSSSGPRRSARAKSRSSGT
jgi:Rne/Rng family ribonuclease